MGLVSTCIGVPEMPGGPNSGFCREAGKQSTMFYGCTLVQICLILRTFGGRAGI